MINGIILLFIAPDVQTLIKWFALRAPEVQTLIKWFALPTFRP